MITKAFGIYDSKAKMYGVPFFMLQEGQAVRAFMDLVNDQQSNVNRHPEDYILFKIGSFNDETAEFESIIPPVQLGVGSAYKSIGAGMPGLQSAPIETEEK